MHMQMGPDGQMQPFQQQMMVGPTDSLFPAGLRSRWWGLTGTPW